MVIYNKNKRLECVIDISSNFLAGKLGKIKGVIDTGCGITRISVCDLYGIKDTSNMLWHKRKMLNLFRNNTQGISLIKSIGVNDSKGKEDLPSLKDIDIINRKDIGFLCKVQNISLNGVSFGDTYVKLLYNAGSPNLIGMSFLETIDWSYESNTAVFTIVEPSNSYSICFNKAKDLFYNKGYTVGKLREELLKDFSIQDVNRTLNELLKGMSYIDIY